MLMGRNGMTPLFTRTQSRIALSSAILHAASASRPNGRAPVWFCSIGLAACLIVGGLQAASAAALTIGPRDMPQPLERRRPWGG